ncbi:unnamed protein product [Rotaria sordida]|uniref:F-box domain-containing protein n=1 Tax=Rotaria sordida TaxID=392033 RepID=A0A819ND74_9BILA|nr:unnamed protein product [Rotaria sordida]
MEYSSVQLNDLSDEILLIIFKNLNNIDLLYSLIGVNKRLNNIVHDSMFTSSLTLFNHSSYNNIYSLSDLMLDRFCFQILPSIHHKIKWIDVEISSMKRILCANYPILSGLGIYNIEKDTDLDIFTDETSLMYILKNQISSLMIESSSNQGRPRDCHSWFSSFQRISFGYLLPTVFSSTLLELRVKVTSVDDCLFLLDGRFNQLRAFYVDIASSLPKSNFKINKVSFY